MNRFTKIILSIPSIFGIFYMVTFWFPTQFRWLIRVESDYNIQLIRNVLIAIAVLFLLLRVWNLKNVDKKIKWTWFLLLIVFNFISSLIYIWIYDDKLSSSNTKHNNVYSK
jgi:FlaA1/EpsC-like NDP-sugar epimerase